MFTTSVELWATPLLFFSMTFTFMLMCLPTRHHPSNDEKKRVVVLVLGDIGRSPRMQHHCLSLARKGAIVDLVGYEESLPRPELLENPNIHRYPLPVPPKLFNTSTPLTFLIFAPFKAFFQFISLLYCLLYVIPPSAGYILLQNPPAIPTLIVTQFVSKLRMQKVVIDWHNFGWSILMMKLNEHPIVWFCKFYEKVFGRAAYANFTVTNAMTKVLKDDMGIKAPIRTLYDRPPMHFIPLDAAAKKEFLESHPATKRHADAVLSGKTKMITSSTSWTQDEDFSQLLAAFLSYDSYASGANFLKPGSAPSILAIITGKGPLKEGYMATIEKLEFQFITVETVWLESADYPKMIACADLGISLHTSTSGVDLPMKIVDLFGVGVPVAAFGFYSLRELVKHRENGIVFKDGQDLGENLKTLFNPSSRELERLKMGAMKETHDRWDENWDNIAAPVFGL